MRQTVGLWGPVLGWALLIFTLSDQPHLPPLVPSTLEAIASKGAHIAEYAVLAALLVRATTSHHHLPGPAISCLLWASALLYGISDEYHQSFVLGRTAEVADVLADAAGALVGILALRFWRTRQAPRDVGAPAASVAFRKER